MMAVPKNYICHMNNKSQNHVVWEFDYHIVFCPKYRFRILSGIVNDLVESDIRLLCEWKGCDIEELSVQPDHIHMVVSIPPKVYVSELMGVVKVKLAIKLFKSYPQLKKKLNWGNYFWSRDYFVNTVGINEEMILRYVKYQEDQDKKEESNGENFTLFD